MKKVLIASFDMEVGGVERSLISMLNNFDYKNNQVDLMLYSHTGDFMKLLSSKHNLIPENKIYSTYRKSIKEVFKEGHYLVAISRVMANFRSKISVGMKDTGYYQMQLMWKYALPLLPKLNKEYDVAISYLWPHYFIAEKVRAKKKIAWIHTDYSTIDTDIKEDLKIWNKFNYIISVSDDCSKAFLNKYPSLKDKILSIENITSPEFIRDRASEKVEDSIERDECFRVVSTGRLCHAKNFDSAVKALKLLHNKGLTNIKWYIVGYGKDEDMIRELIKKNNLENSFILLGKKTNPYPYMKACNLYVQPSRYEGKAVTVTEAKILGKPIVITNYPTAKSQVEHKIDGYITELSVEGIASGIERLYKDKELRDLLASNCRNTKYANKYELEKLYKLF